MTVKRELDWTELGKALRQSALDAHNGVLPPIDVAYSFMADNAECFVDCEEWPVEFPAEPNIELIAAYFGAIGHDCPACGKASLSRKPKACSNVTEKCEHCDSQIRVDAEVSR